ncbi:hypothetical protein D3C80_1423440 [compost metagenome]
MEFHRTVVEVEDKALRQDAKGQESAVIIYKTADGQTFERITNTSGWMAALPGQKRELNVRQFDTHQNAWDNARHFFLPIIMACFTGVYLLMYLSGLNLGYFRLNNVKKPS